MLSSHVEQWLPVTRSHVSLNMAPLAGKTQPYTRASLVSHGALSYWQDVGSCLVWCLVTAASPSHLGALLFKEAEADHHEWRVRITTGPVFTCWSTL